MSKKGRPVNLDKPIYIKKHLRFEESLVSDILKAVIDTGEALGYDVSFNGMVVILCKRGLKGIL